MSRPPELRAWTADELIVDSFAGGGGASLGITMALGRGPDIAINHDAEAIALHAANHPESRHYIEDVWKVDPREATAGKPVGLMWLSPDCKHFSKAKGGKPVSKRVRGLAWVAVRWAVAVRPRVIVLENVEEFQTWGPVGEDGRPCPRRKGLTFRRFVGRLRNLGYAVEWRELRACEYGAPTIRKRLFLIARCDGQPIVWPKPTHGKFTGVPVRTAAECIDWTIPCPSIFGRKKPLATNTERRIAAGLRRFVLENPRPFIVPVKTWGGGGGEPRSLDEPMRTITASKRGEHALVAPYLVPRYGEREGQEPRARSVEQPAPVVVPTQNGGSLVAAFLAKHFGERRASDVMAASLFDPCPTITTTDHNALVTSNLVKLSQNSVGQAMDEPMHTVMAGATRFAEVRAFLVAYFGNERDGGSLFDPMRTVTSRDRFGLVTVEGQEYAIVDIGMRMLVPRELYRAQGFPDSYRIEIPFTSYYTAKGKLRKKPKTAPLSKTAQVRMCGNSVCPDLACAIVRANLLADAAQERAA